MAYKRFLYLAPLFFGLFLAPVVGFGQSASDQVTVKQTVVGSPPTTPGSLTATSTSDTTIDLSWASSTDDGGVAGYQVFREDVFIATSTLVTYTDTGLTQLTQYKYNVRAFDIALNFSSTSANAFATTSATPSPPPPPPPPEDGGGGGGPPEPDRTIPEVIDISVTPGLDFATIEWTTSEHARSTLHWGQTLEYEEGTLAERLLVVEHVTKLVGLSPDTQYFFKIDLLDAFGNEGSIEEQAFHTLTPPDTFPPANIRNLRARYESGKIILEWQNPFDPDFDSVRIIRSEKFYPIDPFDGEVIYDGEEEILEDGNVEEGRMYYYSVFARDISRNYSSGAVVNQKAGEREKIIVPPEVAPIVPSAHPQIRALSLVDFDFIQERKEISFTGNTIEINKDRDLKIAIDYERVPQVLKTLIVTLRDTHHKNRQPQSFLMRINNSRTAYETHLSALVDAGDYPFEVIVLDFKNQGVKKIPGELIAIDFTKPDQNRIGAIVMSVIILSMVLFVLFLRRRRRAGRQRR